MSRRWTLAARVTVIAVAAVFLKTFLLAPAVSPAPSVQAAEPPSSILLAQFNPCPNGKCKT